MQLKIAHLLCKHLLEAEPPASTFSRTEIPKANPCGYSEATFLGEGNKNHFMCPNVPFFVSVISVQIMSAEGPAR